MNTEYYQKYLKYKKKYLDLKNLQYNLENQQGAWSTADPSGTNFLEANRKYYDLSNNPNLNQNDISNAWPTYKLTDRYKMADSGQLYNLYVTNYIFPLNDMSKAVANKTYTTASSIISALDPGSVAYPYLQNLQGLAQIYLANTIRDITNLVNSYLNNPTTAFDDLSKGYHDLSHDIKQGRYYFIPTIPAFINTLGNRFPSLRLYNDDFYGFDISSTKPNVDDQPNGLIQGIYNYGGERLEYLKVDLSDPRNQNIRETEEHNLKILQLLMNFDEAKSDGVLDRNEIARLNNDIGNIKASLINETNRANSLVSDLQKNKNESALAKQVRDKEIKSLKEEREKRNNAISKLGNYLLGIRKSQRSKSNVVTLNSFFGLN